MSIQSEINRISGNVQDTISAIQATGVPIPSGANSDDLPALAQALANEKQDKLTGQQGQYVGFDSNGAAVATSKPTYTASEVGARPSTWTPTASEVGAIPATEKGAASGVATLGTDGKLTAAQKPAYTASEVGARPSTWTPSAADVGAVPTSRTVNGKALSSNITLNASDVGARANNWTPTASEVGAVPTTRTVNSKPLSADINLTAADVGAGAPSTSTTVTLTSTGWTGDSAPYTQQVACSIVKSDSAVVSVDAQTSGDPDANAEILAAWALVSQKDPKQGAGTMTFYATEKLTVNIPVKVGVS